MVSNQQAPPDDWHDRDLVTMDLVASGDPDGLRRLLQDHGGVIRSRLVKDFGRTLDDAEIDEAMSSAVVQVWHSAAAFDLTKGTLRGWTTVIARHCALVLIAMRRQRRLLSNRDLDRLELPVRSCSLLAADQQRLCADVLSCTERLPRIQRAVLLADLEALDTTPAVTLAQLLQTTKSSIYVARRKGRKALRLALIELGYDLAEPPPKERRSVGAQRNVLPRARQE